MKTKDCQRCGKSSTKNGFNYVVHSKVRGKQTFILCNSCTKNLVYLCLQINRLSIRDLEHYTSCHLERIIHGT